MRVVDFVLLGGLSATLAACGSSSSSGITPPKPLPAAPLLSFETLAKTPNTATLASAAGAASQTAVISEGVAGDGNIQVLIGSTLYQLTGSQSGGVPVFTTTQSGTTVDVTQIASQTDALLAFTQIGDGSVSDLAGYSALGNRTPRLEITSLGGPVSPNAVYNGTSYLVATHEDGFQDKATGDLVMDVDFANLLVIGTMTLASTATTGVMNFEIGAVNATFSGSLSADGDVTGVVDVQAGDPTAFPNGANELGLDTNVSGTMTGAIFGPNGQEVGGSFNFTGTEPNTFTGDPLKTIIVQGGYLGKQ